MQTFQLMLKIAFLEALLNEFDEQSNKELDVKREQKKKKSRLAMQTLQLMLKKAARNAAQRVRRAEQHNATGKACSEETHSLRNPVLGAQAPRKKIRNRTLAARKMK
jgi:erythromycin esterase-like protein